MQSWVKDTSEAWKGQLTGVFHKSLNGVPVTITNIFALPTSESDPETTIVYYSHPHSGSKSIVLLASPGDVYSWLKIYKHVQIPDTLKAKIEALPSPVFRRGLIYAAQMIFNRMDVIVENILSFDKFFYCEVVTWGRPVRIGELDRSILGRVKVNVDGIKRLGQLGTPEYYDEIDHPSLFEYLRKIPAKHLARLWLSCPEYFEVLQSFDPSVWGELNERAQKGLLDEG